MAALLPVLISWTIACPAVAYKPFRSGSRAFRGTCSNLSRNNVLEDIKQIGTYPDGFRTSLQRVHSEYKWHLGQQKGQIFVECYLLTTVVGIKLTTGHLA